MTNSKILISGIGALVAGALLTVTISSAAVLSLFTQAIIFALLALGVGVLLKQNGMVSFGHATFFGCAGYAVAMLIKVDLVSAEAAIIIALSGVAIFAFLLGLVVVRVHGIAFGMLTIAVGQMFYQVAARSRSFTGGADGMHIDWPSTLFGISLDTLLRDNVIFMISWTLLILVMMLLAFMMKSRFGSITEAIRDNPERARFIGIRTLIPRATIFAISAAISATGGVLSAFYTGFISPESLHWSVSGMALMMVVVGGFTRLWGPVFGAIIFFLLRDLLGHSAQHWMAIFGFILILVVVFAPTGLSGAIYKLLRRQAAPHN